MSVPPGAFIGHYCKTNSVYESHLSTRLFGSLKEGDVFVDIGANVGLYSLSAARVVGPTGKVIAVEADPRNAQCIHHGAALNGFHNVSVWPIAASDQLRPEALLIDAASNSGVRSLDTVQEANYHLTIGCPLDLLLENEVRVDVIKIDIEAREHRAMIGARKTLERFRPVVYSEFTPHAMRNVGGYEPSSYLEYFFDLGYEAFVNSYPDGNILPFGKDAAGLFALLSEVRYKEIRYLDIMFVHA